MDIVFLVGRIIFGGYFIFSGMNHFQSTDFMSGYAESKGVPMPKQSVILTGFLLVVGGVSIATGLLPQVGLLLLLVFLLPTTLIMHDFWNAGEDEKMNEQINFMKNVALIGALLMLFVVGLPWPLSL
jgi:uncharacterized membrane protein YphA (DoxX/SURF4 family)